MMRNIIRLGWVTIAAAFLLGPLSLRAVINFASQHSTISVGTAAKLNISSLNGVDGTIAVAGNGVVNGPIGFNTGCLNVGFGHQGSAVVTGTYDAAHNTITLANGLINAQAYTFLPGVIVSGTSRIEGQPIFQGDITLKNASTTLYLAIQSLQRVANINLNGGTLILHDDLRLANNVMIKGPGTVNCNGCTVQLENNPGSWGSLSWKNAAINFEGQLVVNGSWTFTGGGRINGNGGELLALSGSLVVADANAVSLCSLELVGVRNGGGLVMNNAQGSFALWDATVWFFGDTTFTKGTIDIASPSTWFLAGHNIKFSGPNGNGSLAVYDALTVVPSTTKEGLMAPAQGTISAPVVFFSNGQFNPAAVDRCVANGALYLQQSPAGGGGDPLLTLNAGGSVAKQQLTSGALVTGQTVTSDVVSMAIAHGSPITINAQNVVFDGRGCSVYFAGQSGNLNSLSASVPASPLFNVAAGASITLKNVRLQNVTQDTFNLAAASGSAPAGVVNFAENVTIDLGDNVVLNQGAFNLVPSISLGNGATVLLVRGVNGKKQLTIEAASPTAPVLSLQNNSLMLQDIELIGAQHLSITPPTTTTPTAASVVLAGNTRVNVGAPLGGVGVPISVNFDVENDGNELALTEDGLILAGAIAFPGIAAENTLEIDFLIPHVLASGRKVPTTIISSVPKGAVIQVAGAGVAIPDGVPYVILSGNPGVELAGDVTTGSFAGMGFGNPSSVVVNARSGSFGIGSASFLNASGVTVVGNKIKETGSQSLFALLSSAPSFIAAAGESVQTGAGIDTSSAARAQEESAALYQTAFGKLRERQRAKVEATIVQEMQDAAVAEVGAEVTSVSIPMEALVEAPAGGIAPKLTQVILSAAAQKMREKSKQRVKSLGGDEESGAQLKLN